MHLELLFFVVSRFKIILVYKFAKFLSPWRLVKNSQDLFYAERETHGGFYFFRLAALSQDLILFIALV